MSASHPAPRSGRGAPRNDSGTSRSRGVQFVSAPTYHSLPLRRAIRMCSPTFALSTRVSSHTTGTFDRNARLSGSFR